jgi:hypothetical protein
MTATGTYVYCVIADTRRPSLGRRPKGLAGLRRLRLLEVNVEAGDVRRRRPPATRRPMRTWAVVADAPLDQFGEAAIKRGLNDLEWVSRLAVAHEAVVESFISSAAVLPMKLFTIFTGDARTLEHIRRQRAQIDRAIARVVRQDEWGVRVVLDRARATAAPPAGRQSTTKAGATFLRRKKAHLEAVSGLARRSREVVADLYDRLGSHASVDRRRGAGELPAPGGPLLLDAAFLVPRKRTARFRAAVAREARSLAPQGYVVTLTGPWPPYTFMQD